MGTNIDVKTWILGIFMIFCHFADCLFLIHPNELEANVYWHSKSLFLKLDLHIEIDNDGRLRKNLYHKRGAVFFTIINLSFTIIRYSRACATQTRLLCCQVEIFLYKTFTVVITNWLTVTKYPFVRWQCNFSLSRRFIFLSSNNNTTVTRLDYMSNMASVLTETGTVYHSWTSGYTNVFYESKCCSS